MPTTIAGHALQPLASELPRLYPITMVRAAILTERSVISLEGRETRDFLQGLVTNDVMSCAGRKAMYTALLTPQGKILFDFFIAADGPVYFIDCTAKSAEELARRLKFYRLRAKITISFRPDLAVAAIWDAPSPIRAESIIEFADPRLGLLGTRLFGDKARIETEIEQFATGDFDEFRLQLGIPDSVDLPPDQVFALDAGLEELNGVSFSKGCYVGQEVTARMKHRATARRRFFVAEADPIPAPGTSIEAQGREVGKITSGKNGRGLALVRLDRVAEAEANGLGFEANGQSIRLRRPEWLRV
jgi:folate-binding protein YgfZ